MIRDPFDNHRKKNIFQATAARTAQHLRDTAAQVGSNALGDMAFSIPRNVPDFGGAHRELEDSAWSALRGGKAIPGLFERDSSLPMYKDKPYGYAPSQRNRPLWRRKRAIGPFLIVVGVLVYLLAFNRKTQTEITPSNSGWSWTGVSDSKNKAAWDERREKVVEAFQLSWDAYERYGWGMSKDRRLLDLGRS